MTRISANELLSRLEKGKAIPAILLLGEEPYVRDRCRALLMERYVPDAARPWAVSRYSADRRETQAALEQAQTMAMVSRYNWFYSRTPRPSKASARKAAM